MGNGGQATWQNDELMLLLGHFPQLWAGGGGGEMRLIGFKKALLYMPNISKITRLLPIDKATLCLSLVKHFILLHQSALLQLLSSYKVSLPAKELKPHMWESEKSHRIRSVRGRRVTPPWL